jgi:hypothetical protein
VNANVLDRAAKVRAPMALVPFIAEPLPDDAPALIDMFTNEFKLHPGRWQAELESGGAIRVLKGPVTRPQVRAWFTLDPPEGVTEFQRISVGQLIDQMAPCLEAAGRDYAVFEVFRGASSRYGQPGQVVGYLHNVPPPCYAGVPVPVCDVRNGPGAVPRQHGGIEPWKIVRDSYRDLGKDQRRKFREWLDARTASARSRTAALS